MVLAWVLVGCGGADGVVLDGDAHSASSDCAGAERFVPGLAHATERTGTTVALTVAVPEPPDVGDNTWTLLVTDGEGPVEGATVRVVPWMPLHGHGLVPPFYDAVERGGGVYAVPTFDLVMPGLWEFRVDLAPDASGSGGPGPDAARFTLCAEG